MIFREQDYEIKVVGNDMALRMTMEMNDQGGMEVQDRSIGSEDFERLFGRMSIWILKPPRGMTGDVVGERERKVNKNQNRTGGVTGNFSDSEEKQVVS